MTTHSYIAWVDYSPAERERMRQALAMFKESDTRDELGLGSIRDALADLMFPGTSTIQTRLRYFLFIPWIYRDAERVSAARIGRRVAKKERALIAPLTTTGTHGVFGAVSGVNIQRLPSSVYWNGLRTWGLLRADISQDDLHRHWDELRDRRWHVVAPDDTGIQPNTFDVWDAQLPDPPSKEWMESATLDVTPEEARYVRNRMHVGRCKGSLLGHLAYVDRAVLDSDYPWQACPTLPPKLAELVDQAEMVSQVMHGAAWLYNLALCRKSEREAHRERIDEYSAELTAWAGEAATTIEAWEPEALWTLLADRDVFVPAARGDRVFVERWLRHVRKVGPSALVDDDAATKLIEARELELKKYGRSRFHNPRALNRWGGRSGASRMNFRWNRVRDLLADLYAGLDAEA